MGAAPEPPTWNQRPFNAQRNGNGGRWALATLAVLGVVVATVVATTLIVRDSSPSSGPTLPAVPPSESSPNSLAVASATDTGPVQIITADQTCAEWSPISTGIAHAASAGWDRRDPLIPAPEWAPEQRDQYAAFEAATRDAADRTVPLAKTTPHRVMRILYEQFIAYSRAYVSHLPNYVGADDRLIVVAIGFSSTLNAICDSIAFGSAGARASLVPAAPAPRQIDRQLDPENAKQFLLSPNTSCPEWLDAAKRFTDDTASWRTVDPNIPFADLSLEQRLVNNAAAPIMEEFATKAQMIGRQSGNAVWADLAILSAQYRRGYVSALPTYAPADNDLQVVASSLTGSISEACRVAGN
ncbi:hypothetical protein [Mycolicibacterium vaccae]|uniref:hypothetical protein n=1 Tax=Mycolicibacterium vaccae TaxID=1810 RepID=UPI001F2287C2|nr:hypothetical protein [Mycolicibacterium vaccae]